MSDLQNLQRQLGFAGSDEAVRRYQRAFAEWFAPGARVLDVGCGPGVFLGCLREAGRKGVGVDASAGELALARAAGHEVEEGDALAYLRAHPGEFDGVFCAHLVEHLPPSAAVELVVLMHSAVRPGGRVVVITPDVRDLEVWTERFWLDLTHVRPYPLPLLRRLFEFSGLRVIRSGNDPNSARGASLRSLPARWFRWLRFGELGYRGDAYVVGERTK